MDHERLGYNYRMDELSAAVGLAQIEKIDFLISDRRKIAGWYKNFYPDIRNWSKSRGLPQIIPIPGLFIRYF